MENTLTAEMRSKGDHALEDSTLCWRSSSLFIPSVRIIIHIGQATEGVKVNIDNTEIYVFPCKPRKNREMNHARGWHGLFP